jgi:N-acyl-L-homoserine lactone synthetase
MVEIIKDKTDPRCLDIYRLRYDVVVNQHKMKINESNIFGSDSGKMICDDHDMSDATTHYAIRNSHTGKIVSSIRTIDGNKTALDMEKYNWFQLDKSIKDGGVVEWSRLVSDVSARKTNAALLLYIQSALHCRNMGITNVTFMVDSKATQLMKYYKRWTICDELSNGPVKCDEYEVGRKSHVMLMQMGKPNTYERFRFESCIRLPTTLGAIFIKSYDVK